MGIFVMEYIYIYISSINRRHQESIILNIDAFGYLPIVILRISHGFSNARYYVSVRFPSCKKC